VADGDPGEARGLAEKVGGRLVEGLADTQRKILDLMRKNPAISKRVLAAPIGVSTTAVDKNITSLKAKDLVHRIGPDKGGHWDVIE
jgi:ATP-dependent DNA helicase RecG